MEKNGQTESGAELRQEREARGKLREGHLEAGRQLAADEHQTRSEAVSVPDVEEEVASSTDAGE